MRLATIAVVLVSCALAGPAIAQTSILTSHVDNGRTGANLNESILNVANVGCSAGSGCPSFGKVGAYAVDGFIYAQPLIAANLLVRGRTRNVLYVATMNNAVYAFDADRFDGDGGLLWQARLGMPLAYSDVSSDGPENQRIRGKIGIIGTPVIDPVGGTLYVLARSVEYDAGANRIFAQRLYALDLIDGHKKPVSGVLIQGSFTAAGQTFTFDSRIQNPRPGLVLTHGKVIVSWGSHIEYGHGWVMAYDAQTLAQVGVFCTTCGVASDGTQFQGGGIWAAGRAPAVDDNGYLYSFVGNGWSQKGSTFPSSCSSNSSYPPPPPNYYGESVLKLDVSNGLALSGSLTPSGAPSTMSYGLCPPQDWCYLDQQDFDWGGSGPLIVPGTNVVVGGGKEGRLYLINGGQMVPNGLNGPALLNHFLVSTGESCAAPPADPHHIMTGPVYWQRSRITGGPILYVPVEDDVIRAFPFPFSSSVMHTPAAIDFGGHPGPAASLSANGESSSSGILWTTSVIPDAQSLRGRNAYYDTKRGILRAFEAGNLANELWNSEMNSGRDNLGYFAKFNPPTVANGKVYVAAFPKPDRVVSNPPGHDCSTYPQDPPQNAGYACYTEHMGSTIGYLLIYGLNPPPVAIVRPEPSTYVSPQLLQLGQ
jgi:hypothetical protein